MAGFVDAIVFNMIRDCGVAHTPVDLSAYPNLKAVYEAVGNIPEVKALVTMWEESVKK